MNDTPFGLSISCDTCVMQHSSACADCLVTFMCSEQSQVPVAEPVMIRSSSDAVVLDLDELRAVRLLASAGLVPTLRHREAI